LSPETIVSIINTSIIVLVTTIVYALVWLFLSVRSLLKRWNESERRFYEETMFRLKLGERNGRKDS